MDVTVNIFTPPVLTEGKHYLISVDKGEGLECKFVVEIVKLPEEMYSFFYDQYDSHQIEESFLTVNFFDYKTYEQNEAFYRYTPIDGMNFSFMEIRKFVEDGLAEAIFDFIENNHYGAIVAIPMNRGLSKMYNKVLSENEQFLDYHYNTSYMEQNIHVIEP